MAYSVPPGQGQFPGMRDLFGQGPCVERDGTLYIYDDATLAAFDLSSGNARWRLPSVGISGLFFDDKGDIYLSTSTASLDSIKYSKQIDINNPTQGVLMKIDPQAGKILWSMKPRGNLSYMAGKYIYTFYEFDPGDSDENDNPAGIFQPAFLCITRINPKDGKVMWEYTDDHAPVDVKFDANNIRIVYKKEVRLLHYLSF
jgi:outer membrane protein assembly factor BamB